MAKASVAYSNILEKVTKEHIPQYHQIIAKSKMFNASKNILTLSTYIDMFTTVTNIAVHTAGSAINAGFGTS